MLLIDRYIIKRFLVNFAILFGLLFVFAVGIDLILQLKRFVEAARGAVGDDASTGRLTWTVASIFIDFHGPRLFQFYSYLMGAVAIGAMGFTLAQMHRHKELVAIMASGVSLFRIAVPFLIGALLLNAIQLVNQELILPRLAPLLIRKHGDINQARVDAYMLTLTPDGNGSLFQSPSFDPNAQTLDYPTIYEFRNRQLIRRITAARAVWDDERHGWRLFGKPDDVKENTDRGRFTAFGPPVNEEERAAWEALGGFVEQDREGNWRPLGAVAHRVHDGVSGPAEYVDLFPTDLSPDALTIRQYGQYLSFLSLSQIQQLLETPGVVDAAALRRFKYSRFSIVLANILVMLIALPFFLLREPAQLLRQSVWCAATALPAIVGAWIGMSVDMPGMTAIVGVFLPVIVLIPIAIARLTFVRT